MEEEEEVLLNLICYVFFIPYYLSSSMKCLGIFHLGISKK